MVIRTLLGNSFEATLSSKTNALSVWKGHFSVFCKFLSDKVETIFWEGETKRWRLFKSKFGHREVLRKWFWSYLEPKNEYSERFIRAFFSFVQIFEWRSWNRFWEIEAKRSTLFKSKFGYMELLRNWFWSYLELKNECSEHLKRSFFSFLQIFEWPS